MATNGSFSSLFNLQSKSINFKCGQLWLNCGQNTKDIALLFGQKWLSVITCQYALKINQCQVLSFLAHLWAKYQVYSLTFWPKMAHFHHFSICNQNQSISSVVMCGSFWANYQGYSHTFWPKMAHFHHLSICNQNQSMSNVVIFGSCLGKIPRLEPYFLAKNGSFSSLFNLQTNSINVNFGHVWLIFGETTKSIALQFGQKWLIFITCQSAIKLNQFQFWSFWLNFGQNTKAIALLFGHNWLIFITFQSVIKITQFQFWSVLAHFWATYQGYSPPCWPKMAHFSQCSICNENQSISILVIFGSFVGKIPRL